MHAGNRGIERNIYHKMTLSAVLKTGPLTYIMYYLAEAKSAKWIVCCNINGFYKNIGSFCTAWRTGRSLYQLLTMVDAGGTRPCHPHVNRQPYIYHCATDDIMDGIRSSLVQLIMSSL